MPETPTDFDSFYNRAGELLDLCAEALALTPAGAPAMQFVSPGLPAFDCCPFLAVSGSSLGVDFTGGAFGPAANAGHAATYQRSNLVGFTVWPIRCAPAQGANGKPPPVANKDAAARTIMSDAWTIWNVIMYAIRNDVIWDGRCSEVYFDQAVPVDPEGGCVGWRIPIRVHLGGLPNSEMAP